MSGGLPFPDPIDPGQTVCFRVTIPDDVQYRGAFWGQLFYLTKWFAWERDDANTAKDVAALWFQHIDASYEDHINGVRCGESGTMELRQNPTNPCQLQYNTGSGWVTFADMSSCGGEDLPVTPPYPDGMTDQQRVDYVGRITEFFFQMWYWGAGINRTPESFVARVQQNLPNMADILGASLFNMANAVTNPMQGITQAEISPYWVRTNQFWLDLAQAIACAPTDEGWWLQDASDMLFDYLNSTSDAIFQALNAFSGYMTPEMFSGAGGGGGGFGGYGSTYLPSGITCGYCKQYDFSIDDYGFSPDDLPAEYTPQAIGEYTAGTGFTRIYHTLPTPERSTVGATKEMGGTITANKITVNAEAPTADYTDFWLIIRPSHYDPDDWMQKLDIVPGTTQDYVFEGVFEFDTLCVDFGAWGDVGVKILSVTIEGNYGNIPPDGVDCS